jgi:hypothetical protein
MINQNTLGQPGSMPLPNPGQGGTAYNTAQIHPAAQAAATPPRQNVMNAGHPAMAPGAGAVKL